MLLFLSFMSCSTENTLIEGTTARILPFEVKNEEQGTLKIFHDRTTCSSMVSFTREYNEYWNGDDSDRDRAKNEAIEQCLPWLDRANGEIHLSFALQNEGFYRPLPISVDSLTITHNQNWVRDRNENSALALVNHAPILIGQLFILIIDESGSMAEKDSAGQTRLEKVKQALLKKEVKKAFLPENQDRTNGVVLFRFSDDGIQPALNSEGGVAIIESVEDYEKIIANNLESVKGGYTHLYDAVEEGAIKVLEESHVFKGTKDGDRNPIHDWLVLNTASPTVIVLTDGFNNKKGIPKDTCESNKEPLKDLLDNIFRARGGTTQLRFPPTIYTVGLGSPFRSKYRLPANREVNAQQICGKYLKREIDGDLEREGIDNASLKWIAELGGGEDVVTESSSELAAAFTRTAAIRYHWFELRYKVDPRWVRQSFTTEIELNAFASAKSQIQIMPHGWLDAPPGVAKDKTCVPDEKTGQENCEIWTKSNRYRHVLAVLFPLMGLILFLSIANAGIYNIRRVLTGRLRKPPPQNRT